LKTKHDTPKYGLIYHASLIGQAAPKFKGKISRVLAAKCSLATRVDALGEDTEASIGINARATVEARLRQLEGKTLGDASGVTKMKNENKKLDKDREGAVIAAKKAYNPDKDVVVEEKKEKKSKKEKKEKKDKKSKRERDHSGSDEKKSKKSKSS
jgi:nucleolar protein 58